MIDEVLLRSLDARGVLTLTLNRPAQRNALDPALCDALLAALTDAERDGSVRCVVLAGAGEAFCAGGDLRNMQERRGKPLATLERQERAFGPIARQWLMMEKPTIAKVHGVATGAGAALACGADFAFMAESARMGFTFARVALVPDTGASWLLVKILGLRKAREIALSAELISAKEAAQWGLVTEAAPDAKLEARVDERAGKLAALPTRALGMARRALADGASSTLDEALAREAQLQALCFTLEDHAEGVDAFLAKREPEFHGR